MTRFYSAAGSRAAHIAALLALLVGGLLLIGVEWKTALGWAALAGAIAVAAVIVTRDYETGSGEPS